MNRWRASSSASASSPLGEGKSLRPRLSMERTRLLQDDAHSTAEFALTLRCSEVLVSCGKRKRFGLGRASTLIRGIGPRLGFLPNPKGLGARRIWARIKAG